MKSDQKQLDLEVESQEEVLEFAEPLYFHRENTPVGWISQLALESGDWEFTATPANDGLHTLTHESGVSFLAELTEGKGKHRGTYTIKGCVQSTGKKTRSFFEGVNINGVGDDGWKLRPAQLGAIHSLMAHWSLSSGAATVVLPTGTGKTETMLVTTLVDRAERTLVIVPTLELKDQLAGKFMSWGILRKLGIIPDTAPNPKVLVLNKTVTDSAFISDLRKADVVVSTPARLARTPQELQGKLKKLFSHVYFDEAHHVVANEWNAIKMLFSESKIVQFTATPYRNDRRPIEGKVVYNYPLSKALEDKCFSKISLVTVDERHPKKKDKAIADAAMSRLLEDRQKGYHRHKMMVRAETRKRAEVLYEAYSQWFPEERIVLVHNQVKGKKAIIQQIKAGKYDIIVCVDMLKEGFDYPDFKIAAVHGVHKTLAVLIQFIGRFTRPEKGLGDASFVVNYAEEKMSIELENLFQEGSGWEDVIKEIADAKKEEAESLLSFLQGCKPYSGYDDPDIMLNPKLVYPVLSCVCFQSTKADWSNFKEAFNLEKYALSQPYINKEENVFYFTTQKREKVKWARTKKMRDQTWNLIVMHHDTSTNLLYIGYTEKRLDVDELATKISDGLAELIRGDEVFRAFDNIKRLCIVHAGIFKPANHLHRYSRLSGADVTTELTRWKAEGRCQKSDFVGVGFRDGHPVGIGASVKGKIWSPARADDLQKWKAWCLDIGRMITDKTIDSNKLLEDSAQKKDLKEYPDSLVVLATDWSDGLYTRIHRLTLELPNGSSFMLSEASLKCTGVSGNQADFTLHILEDELPFSIVLGGENGHAIKGLEKSKVMVDGLKADSLPLEQFFQENPPTMFLLNGCTIAGCVHTNYGEGDIHEVPADRIETLDWKNVDLTTESHYKGGKVRENSIQEYMMRQFVDAGARVVFNDDNSGESADVVAIYVEDSLIRFQMVHCKYSKATSGARLSDLYEVCGQAIVSLRYKWKPEELLKHLERRNGTGVLKNKRFYHGASDDLKHIKEALRYSEVEFEFAIAQPGVSMSGITSNMSRLLGSVYSTVVEMTETKLRCFFSG